MDIKTAKADLKTRQEAVVEEINQIVAQQQQLENRKQELIIEAHRLNGEARLLNRLSGDKPERQR